MTKSPLSWLTDEAYDAAPLHERALLWAAYEADVQQPYETRRDNRHPRIDAYNLKIIGSVGHPWCASVVGWCYLMAGADRKKLPTNMASVCTWRAWAGSASAGRLDTVKPQEVNRGDLFLWCDKQRWRGHMGFVVEVQKKLTGWYIRTIEGNATDDPNVREGIQIVRRWRRVGSNIEFIRMSEFGKEPNEQRRVKVKWFALEFPGLMINGTAHAPIRQMADALGWTLEVRRGPDEPEGPVHEAVVDGKAFSMVIVEGTGYVAVRELADAFGHVVIWRADTKTVEVTAR